MYEFQSEKFSGPLEKLLELIEAQKLGIDDVSLAKVTDGFLAYLDDFKKNGGAGEEKKFRGDLRVLADFVAIASRLILLKSKYLLPGLALTEEEETDIKDLETRLERYRALRPAIVALSKIWRESHTSYSRPYFFGRGSGFSADQHIFYPDPAVDGAVLQNGIQRIFETIVKYEMETETIKDKIVTLEQKIHEVIARITKDGDTQLRSLASGTGKEARAELVVVFLALLHLAREQRIHLEQGERFSDIIVRKN